MSYSKISTIKTVITILTLFIIFNGCADYKLKYEENSKNWKTNVPDPDVQIAYSIYLIGDAGNAPMGESTPLFDHLKDIFTSEKTPSSTIWLGDNLYPVGLAPEGHPDHALGVHRITAQLKTLKEYGGNTVKQA